LRQIDVGLVTTVHVNGVQGRIRRVLYQVVQDDVHRQEHISGRERFKETPYGFGGHLYRHIQVALVPIR